MEAIAAFSLACNVLQVLEFGYGLFQGILYLAQPGEQSLPEHTSASALATHLRSLTERIQAASLPSSVDPKLEDICKRCDEVAQELIQILDSLKVTKKRLLVVKAVRGQFKRKKVELLERRLGDYRSEIQLYITVDLSNRVDVQAAQQLDAYKALRTDSHYLSLTLLTAVKNGSNHLSGQMAQQTGLIESLHLETNRKMHKRVETLRQQLIAEGAQERSHLISSIQSGIRQSRSTTELEIANGTSRVLEANSVTQDTITRNIAMTSQTMQENIYKLNANLETLSVQFAQFDATLGQVVEHHNATRSQREKEKLKREANNLTRTLISLMELYRKFHDLLIGLLDQARSFFGPLKFKELFGQQVEGRAEPVDLSDLTDTADSRQKWSLGSLPRVPLPSISLSDPGFYWISMRVSMMKPIKSTVAPQQGGHYRSQFTSPSSSPYKHSTHESINTSGLTLFYRHYYQPFLPPSSRLLSPERWKHRELRLANPLEEYKKTINRENGTHDHSMAVIELARCGDEFVWFMALVVSAVDACADSQRSSRIIGVVMSLVADWVCRTKASGDADTASLGVAASELNVASKPVKRSFREQMNHGVPIYAGRYDPKFLLGQKLAVDVSLWRKLAEESGLRSEVTESVQKHFEEQRVASNQPGQSSNNGNERLHDAQLAFLLIHTIMISRANMIGRIDGVDNVANQQESAAFPITRIPSTVEWRYQIPKTSPAFALARALYEFGLAGLNFEQQRTISIKDRLRARLVATIKGSKDEESEVTKGDHETNEASKEETHTSEEVQTSVNTSEAPGEAVTKKDAEIVADQKDDRPSNE